MSSIFLIRGSTGRWDDYRDWIVAFRMTRDEAEVVAGMCQRQADEFHQWIVGDFGEHFYERAHGPEAARKKLAMFDVFFECEHTGAQYEVVEVCGDPVAHPSASSYQRMHLETLKRAGGDQ